MKSRLQTITGARKEAGGAAVKAAAWRAMIFVQRIALVGLVVLGAGLYAFARRNY